MLRSSNLGRSASAGLPLFFLLFGVVLAFGAGSASAITGGTPASASDWPFVVTVQVPIGRCTGSVIAPSVVMTSAHCTVDPGTDRPFDPSGVIIKAADGEHVASAVRVPPQFTSAALRGDASIVFLATPLPNAPIRLQSTSDPDLTRTGREVRLAGLGLDNVLREAAFSILGDDRCRDTAPTQGVPFDSDSMFCVAGVLDQSHQCGGDSGGPVVGSVVQGSTAPADQRLIGLISWGAQTCGGINVEADLAFLSAWTAAQLAAPPPPASPPPVTPPPIVQTPRRTSARIDLSAVVRDGRTWVLTVTARHGTDRGIVVVQLQRWTAQGFRTFKRPTVRLGSSVKVTVVATSRRAPRIRAVLAPSARWPRASSRPVVLRPPATIVTRG